MFHDDQVIKKFLELTSEFSTSLIDQDEDVEIDQNSYCFKNSIGGHDVIELKENFSLKDLVPLERPFFNNDTLLKPIIQSSQENILSCNIGTVENPKLIKLSKALSDEKRKRYIKLMK